MIEFFKNIFAFVVDHIQGLSLTASIVLIVLIISVTIIVGVTYKRKFKGATDLSTIQKENAELKKEITELKEESGLTLKKINAMIEAFITVYGNNLKDENTRKTVLGVLQNGYYAETSKLTDILNELTAFKDKAKLSAATVIDKAEDVVKTVGTIAGLRG